MDHDEADHQRENRNQNCCDSTASQGENETDEKLQHSSEPLPGAEFHARNRSKAFRKNKSS